MTTDNNTMPNQPGENPSPQAPNPEVGQPPADPTPTHAPTEAPNSAPQEVPQTRPGEGAGQQTEHPSAPQ